MQCYSRRQFIGSPRPRQGPVRVRCGTDIPLMAFAFAMAAAVAAAQPVASITTETLADGIYLSTRLVADTRRPATGRRHFSGSLLTSSARCTRSRLMASYGDDNASRPRTRLSPL